ncbi:MAG: hypothetical protein A2268_05510 [Candidatus Raymondbacteria bacterium RifOxyA12_full_50_37]|uniref:Elongation factor P n=1 Tax=Candidatus Raymondbacteria bacterium RIFOXYD12_FULL_49_13 TaxID=1817890 RepID=A0A1F7FBJ2_UNCRA|nr:MAG: hypothetical protein A2268_05510 [Candidatus Raymondbacteria bacterium RifOxyA12_full_50_37]OGJ89022.1 MAG: hypothetical protein A2248_02745 [Candidatus Raymondbacteria bacterium RIFOXYA2_FULL_49_16]OGJ97049.1 MAG: hypothetical protein A2453_04160 [Candidatus Raymondbacteria bacterium RIFOXYC2_FULL_50_21]OGK04045.1 MAG: hypothetical protein A2519_00900 [Candidatus Raymondbacteria bacterium RIFOXYD12_FULL_49_13]OGP42012.1 MAG: hypothetical protein A2324_17780 [Candidatus Raymondbacteria 
MALVTPNNLRKKNMIRYNGEPCYVLDCVVRTPPNNRSYVQMQVRAITTNRVYDVRCASSEQFEVLENRYRKLELSYENQGVYYFIDPVTFDQFEINEGLIEDVKGFLAAGQIYEVMFIDENPVLIDLPSTVVMKVVEAPDAVKGNTASNVTKGATMETGLVVQVPLFIKVGESIKVKTEDKSYVGRA